MAAEDPEGGDHVFGVGVGQRGGGAVDAEYAAGFVAASAIGMTAGTRTVRSQISSRRTRRRLCMDVVNPRSLYIAAPVVSVLSRRNCRSLLIQQEQALGCVRLGYGPQNQRQPVDQICRSIQHQPDPVPWANVRGRFAPWCRGLIPPPIAL